MILSLYSHKNIIFVSPINVSKVFDGEFSCQFSMAYYPFDTQRCRLLFQLRPGVDNFVRLQESRLEFVGEREMMRYTIFGVRFVPNVMTSSIII